MTAPDVPNLVPETEAGIAAAAAVIRDGGLVGFLTDTLYGLGADATNTDAVARIFTAKERPNDKPLLVLVADLATAETVAAMDDRARLLAAAFWPGPLTLVLRRSRDCPLVPAVNPLGDTISLRVPARAATRALVNEAGVPITAPSANRSGEPPPESADAVVAGLGDRVDLVLDGGAAADGTPSTVLDLTGEGLQILRAGQVGEAEIRSALT